jgi:itaconate CoA-transferase
MLPPGTWDEGPRMDPVPALGEHTDAILAELGCRPAPSLAAHRRAI